MPDRHLLEHLSPSFTPAGGFAYRHGRFHSLTTVDDCPDLAGRPFAVTAASEEGGLLQNIGSADTLDHANDLAAWLIGNGVAVAVYIEQLVAVHRRSR